MRAPYWVRMMEICELSIETRRRSFPVLMLMISSFASAQNFSSPVKLIQGDLEFLRNEMAVSIQVEKDNLLVDDQTEKAFLEKGQQERNNKLPSSGDVWAEEWVSNFELYPRSFRKGFNTLAPQGVTDNAKYTVILRVSKITLGFDAGAVGKSSQLSGEVLIVASAKPENVLARFILEKVKGRQQFDLKARISSCYNYAGYWIGRDIKKLLKK